jgi:hypothetical protein
MSVESEREHREHDQGEPRRHRCEDRDTAQEAAKRREGSASGPAQRPLVLEASPAREREGDEPEQPAQRHRWDRLVQADLFPEVSDHRAADEHAQGEQAHEEGPDGPRIAHYLTTA